MIVVLQLLLVVVVLVYIVVEVSYSRTCSDIVGRTRGLVR